jgi:hypothetical protein
MCKRKYFGLGGGSEQGLRLTLVAACIAAALTGHKFRSSHPLVFLVHAFLWSPAVEPYRGILVIYLLYWYPCPVLEI